MIDAGLSDILIANQAIGPIKAAEPARLAGLGRVIVAVESRSNARRLAEAARRAGARSRPGGGRRGPAPVGRPLGRRGRRARDARRRAAGAEAARAARLRGPLHARAGPRRPDREGEGGERQLPDAVDAFDGEGLATRSSPRVAGTWDITGANPRITEIHAGSYIFTTRSSQPRPGFDAALTVLATVISRSGDMAVLDCGRKSIGIDRRCRRSWRRRGIRFEHGEHFIHEEHTALRLEQGSTLAVGDRVELMPGYAPTTVNFYNVYYVVADGGRGRCLAGARAPTEARPQGSGPPPVDSMRTEVRPCHRTGDQTSQRVR